MNKTIIFLKEALLEDPNNIGLRLKLAASYLDIKDLEKAKKQLDIVFNLDPENTGAKKIMDIINNYSLNSDKESESEKFSLEEEKIKVGVTDQAQNSDTFKQWFEKSKINFSNVGGMDSLKEEIRLGIVYPFEKPELYEKYGKKIGGGILLYGPPGVGKTYIAKATAGEIKAMFLSIGIDDILDMWLGQSEKKLHKLFETARELAPTVLFVDEVDALGIDRMKIATSATTLVNQFLTEMDGINSINNKVMVIGATNTPWSVDPAFRRPGRFDKIIFVPPPDEIARAEIFKIHLQGKPVKSIDYLELAKKTLGFSGADIAKVCDQAIELVMREVLAGAKERDVNMSDLMKIIKETRATTKEWFITAKNSPVMQMSQAFIHRFCNT